jgi:hypothetical protein
VARFFKRDPGYLIRAFSAFLWKSISLGRCRKARNETAPKALPQKLAWGSAPGFIVPKAASAEGAIHFSWEVAAGLGIQRPWRQTPAISRRASTRIDSFQRRSFLFVIKDSRGTKERNVGKCLRKIPQLSFLTRIVLLGEKPQVVSHIK